MTPSLALPPPLATEDASVSCMHTILSGPHVKLHVPQTNRPVKQVLTRQLLTTADASAMLTADAPEAIQSVTASGINTMLSSLEEVLAIVNNPRTKQLLRIRGSPKYVTRLVKTLQQKAQQEEKFHRCGMHVYVYH